MGGFDDHSRALGRTTVNSNLGQGQVSGAESGAKTAEPAWIDFMQVALEGKPEQGKNIPDDIVRVRIDRNSGLLTHKVDSTSMFEYFEKGTEPTEYVGNSSKTAFIQAVLVEQRKSCSKPNERKDKGRALTLPFFITLSGHRRWLRL